MNECIYKFEFSSIYNKNKNMNYYVLSDSFDYMKMFINQHNLGGEYAINTIQVFNENEINMTKEQRRILKPFHFKTNKNDRITTVITSEQFVSESIENIASELTSSLVLGEAIMRRDIEVFKLIGDLIHNLPVAHIVDFSLAEIDSTDINQSSINDIVKMRNEYCGKMNTALEDGDFYYTCEALFDSMDDDIQPITIECYVMNFAEMLIDIFN